MSNIKIAIVYFSKYGHTRLQAEAVRDGAILINIKTK